MIGSNDEKTHSRLLRVVLMFYISECPLHEYLLLMCWLIHLWYYLACILYILLLTHDWNSFFFFSWTTACWKTVREFLLCNSPDPFWFPCFLRSVILISLGLISLHLFKFIDFILPNLFWVSFFYLQFKTQSYLMDKEN